MKTILIPTDFTTDSLSILKSALNSEEDQKVNIILAYGKKLPWSVMDLIYQPKNSFLKQLEDETFLEAKQIILNKYESKINSFSVEIFNGFNQNAFNNFISGNKINCCVIPESDSSLNYKHKDGFSLTPFIKKTNLSVKTVDYNNENATSAQESLFKLITS